MASPLPPKASQLHQRAEQALRAGDLGTASRALQEAIGLAPAHGPLRNTAGHLLLALGRPAEAIGAYEDAVKLSPGQLSPRINLAQTLIDLGRAAEALDVLASIADQSVSGAVLCRASALIALGRFRDGLEALDTLPKADRQGPAGMFLAGKAHGGLFQFEEAAACLRKADAARPGEPDILAILAKTALKLGQREEAESAYRRALESRPGHREALEGLVQLLWTAGQPEAIPPLFDRAFKARPKDPEPWHRKATVLHRMGRNDEALSVIQEAEQRFGTHPPFDFLAADILREARDLEPALGRARRARDAAPKDWAIATGLVRVLLQAGQGDEALALCAEALKSHPHDQAWLAYRETARRTTGQPTDYTALVGVADLEAPEGFSDMAAFNGALSARLHNMHQATGHPLDQSLREGTQTSEPLHRMDDPILKALFAALKEPLDRFIQAMPHDPDHPFFGRRKQGWTVDGSWSVRLRPNGFHVNHFHGGGWISSAYYVDIPDDVPGAAEHQGWLKFGEPPIPVPGLDGPAHLVEPRAGRIALFPSYLWHGTVPFTGTQTRLTIAMDFRPL